MFINGVATTNFTKYITDKAHLIISNDSLSDNLIFSFNGNNIDGILYPNEIIELLDLNENEIYIKSSASTVNFRLWSYGNRELIYKIEAKSIDVPEIKNYFEKKELY